MGFINLSQSQTSTIIGILIVALLLLDIHIRLNPIVDISYTQTLPDPATAFAAEANEAENDVNTHKPVPNVTFEPTHVTSAEEEDANKVATLTPDELEAILKNAKLPTKTRSELDSCQMSENIFFLKSSKTGSTTMMSIMQRIGLHYEANFLLGENRGGMAVNNRPFNLEKDCWLGKNFPDEKFTLSTNHLHYNKTAMDAVMKSPYVSLGIMREPESQFISSFNFYHNLMPRFTRMLNPDARYHLYEKKKGFKAQGKPTVKDVELEMKRFLSKPWESLKEFPTNSFAWMATIRPQLLFYGKSPNDVESFDPELDRAEVIAWISQLVSEFDLMMILDEFDKSLALIAIEFCIPVEDLLYIAVNQRKEHSEKATIGDSIVMLKQLNWPDFLLYQAFKEIYNRKTEYYEKAYGYDIVTAKAEEIKLKSQQVSNDCIDHDRQLTNSLIDRVFLKQEKLLNSTCLKLQFQGTRATKLFMVKQIQELVNRNYNFCGHKVAYGELISEFEEWKVEYMYHYKKLTRN